MKYYIIHIGENLPNLRRVIDTASAAVKEDLERKGYEGMYIVPHAIVGLTSDELLGLIYSAEPNSPTAFVMFAQAGTDEIKYSVPVTVNHIDKNDVRANPQDYFVVECDLPELNGGLTEHQKAIEMAALTVLKTATDDYASRIWGVIKADVISDVEECADEEFSDGDVALAVGRAICPYLGIDV